MELAAAAAFIALLAWDGWRRWLAHGRRVDEQRLVLVDDLAERVAKVEREHEGFRASLGMRSR
jgi:hypothetical protein